MLKFYEYNAYFYIGTFTYAPGGAQYVVIFQISYHAVEGLRPDGVFSGHYLFSTTYLFIAEAHYALNKKIVLEPTPPPPHEE